MFDYWQARIDNLWRSRHRQNGGPVAQAPVLGFPTSEGVLHRGRALLVFLPDAVRNWQQGITPKYFNPHGASLEWARGLSRLGFETDVLHYDDQVTQVRGDYHLVVAHVGAAISRIIAELPNDIPVVRYATTAHWRWFDAQTEKRYSDLATRRGMPSAPIPTRLLHMEQEQILDQRANLIVSLGEMTTRNYSKAGLNATCIHNAAYINSASDDELAFKTSRGRGFLYQGGAGGVQKGLDLLLEAFAQEPDLHLYLDTWLEPDILAAYRKEISFPNIHFVRLSLRHELVRRKVESVCPFLILSGLNSGQSTAMVAGTARGRIPVVTETADIPWENGIVRIRSSDVDSIRDAIRSAAALSNQDLLQMSMTTRDGFNRYFTIQAFASSIDRVLRSVSQD